MGPTAGADFLTISLLAGRSSVMSEGETPLGAEWCTVALALIAQATVNA